MIGFDTAHGYNNDSHDEAYIKQQANIIKDLVDAYTTEDADRYAKEQIQLVIDKYKNYVL